MVLGRHSVLMTTLATRVFEGRLPLQSYYELKALITPAKPGTRGLPFPHKGLAVNWQAAKVVNIQKHTPL